MLTDGQNLSNLYIGTMLLDLIGCFILAGLSFHTSLYRKRGRITDKLFFGLVITDFVLCLVSAINHLFLHRLARSYTRIAYIGNLSIQVLLHVYGFFLVTLICTIYHGPEKYAQRKNERRVYNVLLAIGVAANIIITPMGLLVKMDQDGTLTYGSLYYVAGLSVPIIFGIISAVYLFRVDKRLTCVLFALVGFRIIGEIWEPRLVATPFLLAIFLVFCHIENMNSPFYGEEDEEKDEEVSRNG